MTAARFGTVHRGNGNGDAFYACPRRVDQNLAFENESAGKAVLDIECAQQRGWIEPEAGLAVLQRITCRPRNPEIREAIRKISRARDPIAVMQTRSHHDHARIL